jgi:hypothetical protein
MIWATRDFPVFARAPREYQTRENTQFLVIEVQIGTKQDRLETRAST